MILPPTDFPAECSLSLTRREAEYLAERIRLSPACSGSLLAELVARQQRSDNVSFAWENPNCAELPPRLLEKLDHAENFSEVMHGAPLLYNLILAEQAHMPDSVTKYRREFEEWAELLAAHSQGLSQWNRVRFWELVRSVNPRISSSTFEFINAWWTLALTGNAAGLCDGLAARVMVRDRERKLKKNLARIDNPRAQELWTGDSGSAQLDFRWRITQRLLGDIFDGLEARDA